jgi:transposase
MMDKHLPIIEEWLKEDETAPLKQRHTAKRIYDRLVDEYGFTGAESTVRRAVAKLRGLRYREVFVPLESVPGKVAQADFGGAVVIIAGSRRPAALFCMRAKYSKVPFVIAYPTEKIEAFLAGHVAAFSFFGGVFHEIWYDNPKTAVTKILAGTERVEHERLSALRAHYLFDSAFCTPGEAHEKGSVENLVGYVRRNALVPVSRSFASFDELNEHLRRWCEREQDRLKSSWGLEQSALRSLPVRSFKAATHRPVVVSKTSLVTIDSVRYSVPARYAGRTLSCEVYVDSIELFDGMTCVASHRRSYLRGDSRLELVHYLPAFVKKPRAAAGCAALAQADPVFLAARDELLASPGGHKVFAEILLLGQEFSMTMLTTALKKALSYGMLSAVVIRQLCLNACHTIPEPVSVPESLAHPLPAPDLSCYNELAKRA